MNREFKFIAITIPVAFILCLVIIITSVESWWQDGYLARDREFRNIRNIEVTLPARGLIMTGTDTFAISTLRLTLLSGDVLIYKNGDENTPPGWQPDWEWTVK